MINRDVTKKSRRKVKAFFLLLMTVCMVFASSFVTLAVEQSGNETRINASDLMEDQLLALEKDTVLYMDKDLTLTGISGANFILFIEGSKTLTVDSMGTAINVYALTAEEGSNLTINCGDREEYSIQTKDSFIFRGANLNIDAYYGMKSSMGDIIIDATQSATIRTRKDCAYLVESVGKKYEVQGVEVSILEKAEAIKASELQDNADIVLEGDTVLEMDVEKTLHSISGEEYRLVVDGPETLKFDTNSCAIRVQNLTVNTDLTVNSTCGNEYSILVEDNFSFNADNLIVDAVFGIKAKKGTISIDANNRVEVYAKKGANIVSEGGAVYIWGQMIWLKNEMQGTDGEGREHGIYASDGVYVIGSGVNNIIVSGTYGIESGSEIRLSGNFTITSYRDAIHAQSAINLDGYFNVESTCRLKYDQFTDPDMLISIYSRIGTISMEGSKLKVLGERGIRTGGNIVIDCEEIDINATLANAVTASSGVSLTADKIRITATYERYKEHQKDSDTPAFFESQWMYGRVVQGDTVKIDSQDAVIKGPTPVFADKSVDLRGDIRLNASGYEAGLKCFEGPVYLDGDIGIYMDEEDDCAFGIYADKSITARGTGLYIKAPLGMYTFGGGIDLDCDTISVKTTAGYGMEALKLPVHIKGGNLNIETAFDRKDAFRGGDCIGINAKAGVRLDCASAEILAPVGIQVSDGDVYLNGYSNISVVKKGVYVDTGDIYINGYTHIAMQSGGDYPIRSEKKRIIVNPSLPMIYPNGGNIQAGPGMVLDSEGNIPRYVEFGKEISEISFSMDVPVEYNIMSNKADAVYDLTPGCHVKSVDWYEDGEKVVLSGLGNAVREFKGGKKYKATVLIETDDEYLLGYGFRKDDAIEKTAVVNGENADSMGYMTNGKEVQVSYDFGTCPTGFYTVNLSVDAPKDGVNPDTSITAEASGYGVRSANVTWFVSDDGEQYKEMSSGTSFVGGKYYKVSMIVEVPGENFALGWTRDSVTGELEPRTRAFINEKQVDLVPVDGKDHLHYAEVSYEFGKCNSSIIREIEVVGVTEPVAGEYPNYVADVRGTGYHINTSKNKYEDIYWKNPPETWYYIRNGVGWFDLTEFDWVYENDTFISGHEYQVNVYLNTDDGYTFYHSNSNGYYEMLFTATVNGNTAMGNTSGSSGLYEQTIMCNFICGEPQGGNNSYSVSGDVTSSGSEIADVTIQLYEEKNPSEPAYETTAVGNDASYMIAGVAPGTYTMKVKKANHVTREYEVTVVAQNLELDAKIHLLGDISGDGQVNIADNTRMIRHIKKTKLLTGYEFEVADISGDDQVNIADNTRMIRHIKKTKLLW